MSENDWLIDYTDQDPAGIWKKAGRTLESLDALTQAQLTYFLVWGVEGEVNNGGFEQFIGNSTGDTAELVPDALRQIGAPACAVVVESALRTLSPDPLPRDSDERNELLGRRFDQIASRLDELDEAFYACPDDLTHLLYAFIHAYPGDFGLIGSSA